MSYRDGQECGREEIITAGATERLHLLADRSVIRADGRDLCFVTIKAVDADGLPVYNESGKVTVKVMGARLQGLGNADPMTDNSKIGNVLSCIWDTYEVTHNL